MKAFPQAIKEGYFDSGMDLRDYFAAKAMEADISNALSESEKVKEFDIEHWSLDEIAKRSYRMADEMMKAREVK